MGGLLGKVGVQSDICQKILEAKYDRMGIIGKEIGFDRQRWGNSFPIFGIVKA